MNISQIGCLFASCMQTMKPSINHLFFCFFLPIANKGREGEKAWKTGTGAETHFYKKKSYYSDLFLFCFFLLIRKNIHQILHVPGLFASHLGLTRAGSPFLARPLIFLPPPFICGHISGSIVRKKKAETNEWQKRKRCIAPLAKLGEFWPIPIFLAAQKDLIY